MSTFIKEKNKRMSELGGPVAFREKLREISDHVTIKDLISDDITIIESNSESEDAEETSKRYQSLKRCLSNSFDSSFEAQRGKRKNSIDNDEAVLIIDAEPEPEPAHDTPTQPAQPIESSFLNTSFNSFNNNQQQPQPVIINTNLPNSFQYYPFQPQQVQFSQPMSAVPLMIPAGYTGPILFQPTIHIHTNDKRLALLSTLSRFKTIKPKSSKPS